MSIWYFLCWALLVFAVRCVLRKVTRAEVVLVLVVAVNSLVIKALMLVDQNPENYGRYYYPAFAFLAGLAALPLAGLVRLLPRRGRCLCAVLGLALVFGVALAFYRGNADDRGMLELDALARHFARAIRADWGDRKAPPRHDWSPDCYYTLKAPSILSFFSQLPYYADGDQATEIIQRHPEKFPDERIDYYCIMDPLPPNANRLMSNIVARCQLDRQAGRLRLVETRALGPVTFQLWARKDEAP